MPPNPPKTLAALCLLTVLAACGGHVTRVRTVAKAAADPPVTAPFLLDDHVDLIEARASRARPADPTTTTTEEPSTTLPPRVEPPARPSASSGQPASAAVQAALVDRDDPRSIGQRMLYERGYGSEQWPCLDRLWGPLESGWDPHASNRSSGAYGIPQALPGSKMAANGDDWRDNPATQIAWGLDYVVGRYGTPCEALNYRLAHGSY